MRVCGICGEKMNEGSRTCQMCGTSVAETVLPQTARPAVAMAAPELPRCSPGTRACPACGKTFAADYADTFCFCGVELVQPPSAEDAPADAPEEVAPEEVVPLHDVPERPPAGTPCLVLYDDDRRPLLYFPLTQDATLIGRLDAVAGNFPDIDVTEFLDPPTARKVSRKHALVLRSRATRRFAVRPLAGNTGTQIEGDMVAALSDYPLNSGMRLVLGGAVRFKFEIM